MVGFLALVQTFKFILTFPKRKTKLANSGFAEQKVSLKKWTTKEWKTTREIFSMENKRMENKQWKTRLNTSLLVK